MKLTRYMMAAAVPIILLIMVWPNAAHAQYWNAGPGAGGDDGFEGWHGGYGNYAGVVDAQSDYHNNSAFAPYPSYCCHSYLYKQTFADGYQHEWNILQEQKQQTYQGIDNHVNVENSPGAQITISNGQSSNQGQGQDRNGGWDGGP